MTHERRIKKLEKVAPRPEPEVRIEDFRQDLLRQRGVMMALKESDAAERGGDPEKIAEAHRKLNERLDQAVWSPAAMAFIKKAGGLKFFKKKV